LLKLNKSVLFISISFFLVACGGSTSNKPTNLKPEITSSTIVEILENSETTGYRLQATDPDSDELTYRVTGGDDANRFTINSRTGQLKFGLFFEPNFEQPKDADNDNIYHLDVEVSDERGGIATGSLVIKILDDSNYVIEIESPDHNTNYGTNYKEIMVSGSIYDREDYRTILPGEISDLRLNGEPVTFFDSEPNRWFAYLTPSTPRTVISAQLFINGVPNSSSNITVVNKFPLIGGGAAYDTINNRLIMGISNFIQSYDLNSNTVNLVMIQEDFESIGGIFIHDIEYDSDGVLFYVTDSEQAAIYSIDLETKDVSLVSGNGRGNGADGEEFAYPKTIALDMDNSRLFVLDTGYGTTHQKIIFEVNLDTGNRTVVYSSTVGTGPKLSNADEMVYDKLNRRLLVIDKPNFGSTNSNKGLMAVDVISGDSEILADDNSLDARLRRPSSLALDKSGNRAFVYDILRDTLLEIDFSSKTVSEITATDLGSNYIRLNESMGFNPNTMEVLLIDDLSNKIISIDVDSGAADVKYSHLDL
jgi:DNA-binding beta-propeller fold protein YncE